MNAPELSNPLFDATKPRDPTVGEPVKANHEHDTLITVVVVTPIVVTRDIDPAAPVVGAEFPDKDDITVDPFLIAMDIWGYPEPPTDPKNTLTLANINQFPAVNDRVPESSYHVVEAGLDCVNPTIFILIFSPTFPDVGKLPAVSPGTPVAGTKP